MVEPTHLKNMIVKLDHVARVRGENSQNILETTTLKCPSIFVQDSLNYPKFYAIFAENPNRLVLPGVPDFPHQ